MQKCEICGKRLSDDRLWTKIVRNLGYAEYPSFLVALMVDEALSARIFLVCKGCREWSMKNRDAASTILKTRVCKNEE